MSDQVEQVEKVGFGANLMESIKGVAVGGILFFASFWVLWVNEGRVDLSEVAKKSIAVKADSGWLLHCGDAYFYHGEMESSGRRCTPLLSGFQSVAQFDGVDRRHNQERLRQLATQHGDQVRLFCAHDPTEFLRFSSAR